MRLRVTALIVIGATAAASLISPQKAAAVNGTWTKTADGTWSVGTNWASGTIADGANNTANFNTLNIADQFGVTGVGPVRVTLDSPRTIGHLTFGDTNLATPGAWDLTDPTFANLLTLTDATKPTITANPLTPFDPGTIPPTVDDSRVSVNLAGDNGFNKLGTGILTLAGNANTLTGVINVNAGTLRVATGSTFDFETATTPAVLSFNLANTTTLDARAFVQNITAGNGVTINGSAGLQFLTVGPSSVINSTGGGIGAGGNVAALNNAGVIVTGDGARSLTINTDAAGTNSIGAIGGGAGLAASINISGAGLTRFSRDWAQNGGLPTLNVKGTRPDTTQSLVELHINGGNFGGAGFTNTALNLDNVILYTNQNTSGNDVTVGALSGTATSVIRGGIAGAGSSHWFIGGLNTNTTFAGDINTDADHSVFLTKQGTGTLTLSGNLNYTPGNTTLLEQRGGITRVLAGTLKLAGTATLPAGINNATLGDLLTTVDIRAGATLDVSGRATTYQSQPLQQTIGTGTIIGPYKHADGMIAPGNTSVLIGARPTQDTIAAAGTMAITGNFELSSGQYLFDMSPNTASGNDRITVSGATALTGGQIVVNYIGGAPTPGTTYTLLTSGSFTGSAANLLVDFPGRGIDTAPFVSGGNLQVTVPAGGVGNLVWRGNDSTNPTFWDVQTTSNWLNTGTAAADKFFTADAVTFDNTATSFNVVLQTADVRPASVTVNNSVANPYSISGTRRIIGSGSLTKTGPGTLTITTTNNYSGGTTISGGIINRDAAGGLGTGTITLSGGTIQTRGWTNPAPIAVTAATTNSITLLGGGTEGASTTVAVNLDGALSGSGTLEIRNDTNNAGAFVAQAIDIRTDNTTFTGTLKFVGTSRTAPRFTNINAAGTNVALDLGNGDLTGVLGGGTSISSTVQSASQTLAAQTIVYRLGSIEGGPNSRLDGYGSGNGIGPVRWEIGGRNTSTVFQGLVTDGNMANVATTPARAANITSITKVGTGTLTLEGLNTYTGTTTVAGGVLSIKEAYLADASDVRIQTGGVLNLNFVSPGQIDIIDALFLNGVPQALGVWGRVGSKTAFPGIVNFESPFLTGDGLLQVSYVAIPGDFDGNHAVRAADLAFWQNNLGTSAAGDADNDGDTDGNDFLIWQRNLGMGTPVAAAASGAVPEPAAWALAAIVVPAVLSQTRRRA